MQGSPLKFSNSDHSTSPYPLHAGAGAGQVLKDCELARLEFIFTLTEADKDLIQGLMSPGGQSDCANFFNSPAGELAKRWRIYTTPAPPVMGSDNQYRLVPGPAGWPTFEMLMYALLERRRRQNQKMPGETGKGPNGLKKLPTNHNPFISATSTTSTRPIVRPGNSAAKAVKKAILRGILSVSLGPAGPTGPVSLTGAGIVGPPSSTATNLEIQQFLGLHACTAEDAIVLGNLWRLAQRGAEGSEGSDILTKMSSYVGPMEVLHRQITLISRDLGLAKLPDRHDVSFLMRYGAYHTPKIWTRCLELSTISSSFQPVVFSRAPGAHDHQAPQAPPNPWSREFVGRLDASQAVSSGNHEDVVFRPCYNWPGRFFGLLREHFQPGLPVWRHSEDALSLFYNAIMVEMGPEFTREFTADLICLFLNRSVVFNIKSSKLVLKTLRALLMRTYLPSIFTIDPCITGRKIHLKMAQLIR